MPPVRYFSHLVQVACWSLAAGVGVMTFSFGVVFLIDVVRNALVTLSPGLSALSSQATVAENTYGQAIAIVSVVLGSLPSLAALLHARGTSGRLLAAISGYVAGVALLALAGLIAFKATSVLGFANEIMTAATVGSIVVVALLVSVPPLARYLDRREAEFHALAQAAVPAGGV